MKKVLLEKKRGKAEIVTLILYIIGVCVIGFFHEPWFDEAQAWQIARCASLKEILFEIPHYEGHPQLWHLILMPFAKLHAPYELTLFSVNFAFCLSAVILILYRSPFPKIIRCWIPFTYFFFYQYGVISRPYSMMMLAFILAAMTYQNRNAKPVRYILSLSFLCATSSYGILFAGGLCIVWTIEIFEEYRKNKLWNRVVADGRVYALSGILLFAVFLAVCISPAEDCYYDGNDLTIFRRLKLLPYVLIFPFDSVIGCYLNEEVLTTGGLVAECIGGVLFWFVLLKVLHANRKKALFLVPYSLFMIFSIFMYFSTHHLGISMLFMVFVFWIMADTQQGIRIPELFITLNQSIRTKSIRQLILGVGVLAMTAPLIYTGISSVNEIRYCYGTKGIFQFIRENDLADRKIMALWLYDFQEKNEEPESVNAIIWDETLPAELPQIKENYPHVNGIAAVVSAYFDRNIFMNFNAEDPRKLYVEHTERDDNAEIFASWREQGLPEILIGLVPLQEIYTEEELKDVTYYWVDTVEIGKIWKQYYKKSEAKIYIRSDILEDYPQFEIQKY